MTTILAFVFVLGVLVFVHELGHFLVAKWAGIKVERFALGFPPFIYSKTVGETAYSIGIIPLGGFVKMLGENPDEEVPDPKDPKAEKTEVVPPDPNDIGRSFMDKSVAKRAAVIIAGPLMNYVLAILVLIGLYTFAGRPIVDETKIVLGEVSTDSPASRGGLMAGDQIVSINGKQVTSYDSLRAVISANPGTSVELEWLRGSEVLTGSIVPLGEPVPNEKGTIDTVGRIGIAQKIDRYESYPFTEAVAMGFTTTHELIGQTVLFVKRLIFGEVSTNMLGGPIFIAKESGNQAKKGLPSLLFFMALLSINLAVLNVLPIPVLDGGHLIFLAIEAIKGSPVNAKGRLLAQQIGMGLLLILIVMVTYNDILRMIRGY